LSGELVEKWAVFAPASAFGEPKPVCLGRTIGELEVLVIATPDGSYYAIDRICSHASGVLDDGDIEDFEIECALHGSRFDIRTGDVTLPPATEGINTYAVRVVDDEVLVALPVSPA
jgi:3-phenylpropionate/trans-cinnamate dioxygenase ferredoxin subunit